MSTRLYLTSDTFSYTNAAPAFCSDAVNGIAWNETDNAVRYQLVPTPWIDPSYEGHRNPLFETQSITKESAVHLSGAYVLYRQYISMPLSSATTVSQTVKAQLRISQSETADIHEALVVSIFSGDGQTLRGIVYKSEGVSDVETSLTNRNFASSNGGLITSTVEAQIGDVIVVEIGAFIDCHGNPCAGDVGSIEFGTNAGSDLPENNIATDQFNPWIEFSQDFFFNYDLSYKHPQPYGYTGQDLFVRKIQGAPAVTRSIYGTVQYSDSYPDLYLYALVIERATDETNCFFEVYLEKFTFTDYGNGTTSPTETDLQAVAGEKVAGPFHGVDGKSMWICGDYYNGTYLTDELFFALTERTAGTFTIHVYSLNPATDTLTEVFNHSLTAADHYYGLGVNTWAHGFNATFLCADDKLIRRNDSGVWSALDPIVLSETNRLTNYAYVQYVGGCGRGTDFYLMAAVYGLGADEDPATYYDRFFILKTTNDGDTWTVLQDFSPYAYSADGAPFTSLINYVTSEGDSIWMITDLDSLPTIWKMTGTDPDTGEITPDDIPVLMWTSTEGTSNTPGNYFFFLRRNYYDEYLQVGGLFKIWTVDNHENFSLQSDVTPLNYNSTTTPKLYFGGAAVQNNANIWWPANSYRWEVGLLPGEEDIYLSTTYETYHWSPPYVPPAPPSSWCDFWDGFTGNDGDYPNSNLWYVQNEINNDDENGYDLVTGRIQSNQLHCSYSENTYSAYDNLSILLQWAYDVYYFTGDFDIQVDFNDLIAADATGYYWFFGMRFWYNYPGALNDWMTVGMFYNDTKGKCYGMTNGNYPSLSYDPEHYTTTTDTHGKFRMTRVGNLWTGYYWNNSSEVWVEIASFIPDTVPGDEGHDWSDPVAFSLESCRDHTAISFSYDNFEVFPCDLGNDDCTGDIDAICPDVTAYLTSTALDFRANINASLRKVAGNLAGTFTIPPPDILPSVTIHGDAIFGPVSYVYYRQETQAMASMYPEGFRVREDKWSIGQQYLHGISRWTDELISKGRAGGDGTTVTNAHLNCLDTVYPLFLGDGFQFEQDVSDPRLMSYRLPFLQGKIGTDFYTINGVTPNDLQGLDEALPNRWQVQEAKTVGNRPLSPTAISQLATATIGSLSVPGYVYLTLSGLAQKGVYFKGKEYLASVTITGQTTKGTIEEETIFFPTDLPVRSNKRYKSIASIKPLNIVPDTCTVSIDTVDYKQPYCIDNNYALVLGRREQYPVWSLQNPDTDYTLNCEFLTIGTERSLALSQYMAWLLVDEAGQTLIRPSMALVPHRKYIAVATQDCKLLFYNKQIEYPSQERLNLIKQRTPDTLVSVESDYYFYLPDEIAQIMALQPSAAQQIQRYRWLVAPPGQPFSVYKIDSFSFMVPDDTNDGWIEADYSDNKLTPIYSGLNLTTPGYWGVALESIRLDGTRSKDVRLFGAMQKSPEVVFDMSAALTVLDGIFYDGDENLWIKHGPDVVMLKFFKDLALVDYEKKIILFKERYDEVEVTP